MDNHGRNIHYGKQKAEIAEKDVELREAKDRIKRLEAQLRAAGLNPVE